MECTIVFDPVDSIVKGTEPYKVNEILIDEALKLVKSPGVKIRCIENGVGWLVKLDEVNDTLYFALVTIMQVNTSDNQLVRSDDRLWQKVYSCAKSLLYSTPLVEIGCVTIDLNSVPLRSFLINREQLDE
jgi:hypothetical protein